MTHNFESAEDVLDAIGVLVGWADNPDPENADDAVSAVLGVLDRWAAG